MTNVIMSGVSTHLMTNIRECYDKVSQTITELLLEGQNVVWKHFGMKKCSSRLDSVKAVLNTTNATKDNCNMIIC